MAERLRIIYLSHYFPPEVNAPAARVSEMAERWVERGADVTVITCFPNHPSGVIPDEYKGLVLAREKYGAINVVRTWVYAAPNKGLFKRALSYFSFMISSIILGAPVTGKADVLIATSPQFFVAVAGYVISRLKRCRFVFEVRDLWPEEIVTVGALKNKFAVRILETIEMFLYRKADLIVAVAQGAVDTLKQRGIPAEKITLIPNGVDVNRFHGATDGCETKKQLGLEGKFVVGYIGTHGMAHRLNVVLDAALILKQRDDIRFLFVGDGAEKANLVADAARLDLQNVIFHDQVDRARVPSFYKACDVCLVPLKKADMFTRNVPSKIYEIMASGRPIIISTEGESRRLVESSGAGLAAAREDSIDLARKISSLRENSAMRDEMSHNGLSFVLANSSRARHADDFLAILVRLARGDISQQTVKKAGHTTEDMNRSKEKAEVLF